MTLLEQWHEVGETLKSVLEQHTAGITSARASLLEATSQFTIAQLGIGSLGTQIDDAEKRVDRRVDRLERKLDALLRASNLNPEDFAHD